MGSEFKFLG